MMDEVPADRATCFECGAITPASGFCSNCGAPLALKEYIARSVAVQVANLTSGRDVIERESAQRVFEKAVGWIKLAAAPVVLAMVVIGGVGIWQFSDWKSAIQKSEKAIAADASSVKAAASDTRAQITQETDFLKQDIASSRQQLLAAAQLEPQMREMRTELDKTSQALTEQQKLLSSSEDFARAIFSTHTIAMFQVGVSDAAICAVIPSPMPDLPNRMAVFFLLPSSPLPGTLQLQYHVFSQPPNSYFSIHNMVVFLWADSMEVLKQKPISISYFPAKADGVKIEKLSIKDGRVFADDEPMPKWNDDPDFHGNKWFNAAGKSLADKP